jgi:PHP family Zn ribbon phosphoesterase
MLHAISTHCLPGIKKVLQLTEEIIEKDKNHFLTMLAHEQYGAELPNRVEYLQKDLAGKERINNGGHEFLVNTKEVETLATAISICIWKGLPTYSDNEISSAIFAIKDVLGIKL